jgi:hypothetical protein
MKPNSEVIRIIIASNSMLFRHRLMNTFANVLATTGSKSNLNHYVVLVDFRAM